MPTPNFEYDLSISYAHIDNQHYSEVPQGWVDYLQALDLDADRVELGG